MKQTSIDKINKVYVAIKDHEEFKMYAELLKDVIRAEAMTPVKAGKFNIYNYVADDDIRPAMNGVFLDRGNKVASDSHILISIKEEYEPEYEGRVMYKDGSFYDMRRRVKDEDGNWKDVAQYTSWEDENGHRYSIYPKWESVIPREDGYSKVKVDREAREKFYKWVEEKRVEHKAEYGKGTKWDNTWYVKLGNCGFKAVFLDKLFTAMDFLGTDEVFVHPEGRRAAMVKSDKGVCILMPVMIDERFNGLVLG